MVIIIKMYCYISESALSVKCGFKIELEILCQMLIKMTDWSPALGTMVTLETA
jgi:hypothetical protein